MSTRIDFDFKDEEEEEEVREEGTTAKDREDSVRRRVYVDAFIPAYGWIPVERMAPDTVRLLDENEVHVNCRTAPLFSRSLRDEYDSVRPGQGVGVEDHGYDPAMSDRAVLRGIVESVEDNEILVRVGRGDLIQVHRSQIQPFTTSIPSHAQAQLYRSDMEHSYNESLRKRGLWIEPMRGDGNCLFRAVAHQVYGNPELHRLVRRACADYMTIEKSYFEPFVAEASGKTSGRAPYSGFDDYMMHLCEDGTWGDDPELEALCEIYQRPAEIYFWDPIKKSAEILRRLNDEKESRIYHDKPLRLSFMGGGHYDSIVDISYKPHPISVVPGRLEEKAIELAKARHAGGVSMATKLSDVLETDSAQMEAALARSRMQSEEARNSGGFNLQEALEKSLQSVVEEEKGLLQKAQDQSLRDIEEEELRRALEESMKGIASQQRQDDFGGEDDDEVLRLAIQQSLHEW